MNHKSADIQDVIDASVRERVGSLSRLSFNELIALPSHQSENIVWKEKQFVLSVWHDVLLSREHRVVVQAYRPGVLIIGRMQADGFAINDRDEKRSLTVEEWAPFS